MSSLLSYKGYAARIEFSSEDECFVGHIAAELSGKSINQWAIEALNREANL